MRQVPTLTPRQCKALESLPGWTWFASRREERLDWYVEQWKGMSRKEAYKQFGTHVIVGWQVRTDLSPEQKAKLATIPWWSEYKGRSGKEVYVRRFREIVAKYKTFDSLPHTDDLDMQRRKDAVWIANMRARRLSRPISPTGKERWYPVLEEEAKAAGWHTVWDDQILVRARQCLQRAQAAGRLPKHDEAGATFLVTLRKQLRHGALQRKYRTIPADLFHRLAAEYGFPHAFRDRVTANSMQLLEIMKKGVANLSAEESALLDGLRRSKALGITRVSQHDYGWDEKYQALAIQHNHPTLFELPPAPLCPVLATAHEVFAKAKERGYLPRQRKEHRDYKFIANRRRARYGKGKTKWYPELIGIATMYGFPNAFDEEHEIKRRAAMQKDATIKMAHEVFARAKARGSLPRQKDEKDYRFILIRKQARYGTGHRGCKWYPELAEVAGLYGFPHAFTDFTAIDSDENSHTKTDGGT